LPIFYNLFNISSWIYSTLLYTGITEFFLHSDFIPEFNVGEISKTDIYMIDKSSELVTFIDI